MSKKPDNRTAPKPASVARRFEVCNLADGETAEVYLYDTIGDYYGGVTAKAFIDEVTAKAATAKNLTININSPGGSVYDADAIVSFLNRHPAEKVCNIDGICASAAVQVALACPVRNMAAQSMMMVHHASDFTFGNAKEMRKTAAVLDKLDKACVDSYVAATGQDEATIIDMLDEETWMGAQDAVEAGFATAVVGEKTAAALAGVSAAAMARLGFKHPENMTAFVSAENSTEDRPGGRPTHKETEMTKETTKPGETAGAGESQPVNVADHIKAEGKRYMDAFGAENGAKYFTAGMSFEAAQAQALTDLTTANKAKDTEIADLKTKLAASNKALGTEPLSADIDGKERQEEQTPGQKKYESLLSAFNGDEKRAKKVFAAWQKQQDKKAAR